MGNGLLFLLTVWLFYGRIYWNRVAGEISIRSSVGGDMSVAATETYSVYGCDNETECRESTTDDVKVTSGDGGASLPTSVETEISAATGDYYVTKVSPIITASVGNNSSSFTAANANVTTLHDVTTQVPVIVKYTPGPDHHCNCDITKNECDMNCCCDKDCAIKDKSVFAACFPIGSQPTTSPEDYSDRYCYASRFIFSVDKQVSRIVEKNNGLFCIAYDNLPAGIIYEKIATIRSIDEFDRKLRESRKGIFSWPHVLFSTVADLPDRFADPSNITEYKYGDYIWSFMNFTQISLTPFFVPGPRSFSTFSWSFLLSVGRVCDRDRPIFYLKDADYSCVRKVPQNKYDCETLSRHLDISSYYDKDLRIVAVPQTINNNSTSLWEDCSEETCISLIARVCLDDTLFVCYQVSVNNTIIPKPTYIEGVGVCSNMIDKVSYVIRYNENRGITRIDINFHLVNLSSSSRTTEDNGYFRQYFKIKHYRSVYSDRTSSSSVPLVRSGTPGYLPGKPIIAGKRADLLLTGSEKDNDSSRYIVLNNDRKYWLTLSKSAPRRQRSQVGWCDENDRLNILFLENIKSECLTRYSLNCDSARGKSAEMFLGPYYSANVTDLKRANIYASSYGDPDPSDWNGWVPILIRVVSDSHLTRRRGAGADSESCDGIFTDVHVKVLYSYAGIMTRPQAKIVGALMSFSFDRDAIVRQENDSQIFRITSTVSFVDISKPDDAVVKFADPPVYEIKLPADFFYPFLSSCIRLTPLVPSTVFIISIITFFYNCAQFTRFYY